MEVTGIPRGKTVRPEFIIVLLMLLCGCASYTNRLAETKTNYVCGSYTEALKNIDPGDCEGGVDQLIFLLERANIKQAMGDFKGSNEDYEKAYCLIKDYESRPEYNIRAGLSEGGALFTNETVLPYKGEGYEKILIHAFKAINFMMLGDLNGARVEIRRLNERLKQEKKIHEDTISSADQKAREKNINSQQVSELNQQILNSMGATANLASEVKSLYLSAYGSYLSSILYDMDGDYDDARIDAVRVIEIVPDFEYAAVDAAVLGAENIILSPGKSGVNLREKGELVLFYQCGLAPVKTEVKIAMPVPNVGVLATAFAVYRTIPTNLHRAIVYVDGNKAGHTEILTDVEAQAIRTLVDNLPYTIVRAALRATTKGVTTYVVKEQFGLLGTLAASIYNVASESADLRSWLTLPRNIQGLKIYPPKGKHRIKIALVDHNNKIVWRSKTKQVEFRNDQTVFINLRGIGYTPLFPNGVNVTHHWVTLPRVPLSERPNYLIASIGTSRRIESISSEKSRTATVSIEKEPDPIVAEEKLASGWLSGLSTSPVHEKEPVPPAAERELDSDWLSGLSNDYGIREKPPPAAVEKKSSPDWL